MDLSVSTIDQRKESIVFSPTIQKRSTIQTFVKTGPDIKSFSPEGHVGSYANPPEVRKFKPRRRGLVHSSACGAAGFRPSNLRRQAFRLGLKTERHHLAGHCHDRWILKLAGQAAE